MFQKDMKDVWTCWCLLCFLSMHCMEGSLEPSAPWQSTLCRLCGFDDTQCLPPSPSQPLLRLSRSPVNFLPAFSICQALTRALSAGNDLPISFDQLLLLPHVSLSSKTELHTKPCGGCGCPERQGAGTWGYWSQTQGFSLGLMEIFWC